MNVRFTPKQFFSAAFGAALLLLLGSEAAQAQQNPGSAQTRTRQLTPRQREAVIEAFRRNPGQIRGNFNGGL